MSWECTTITVPTFCLHDISAAMGMSMAVSIAKGSECADLSGGMSLFVDESKKSSIVFLLSHTCVDRHASTLLTSAVPLAT